MFFTLIWWHQQQRDENLHTEHNWVNLERVETIGTTCFSVMQQVTTWTLPEEHYWRFQKLFWFFFCMLTSAEPEKMIGTWVAESRRVQPVNTSISGWEDVWEGSAGRMRRNPKQCPSSPICCSQTPQALKKASEQRFPTAAFPVSQQGLTPLEVEVDVERGKALFF